MKQQKSKRVSSKWLMAQAKNAKPQLGLAVAAGYANALLYILQAGLLAYIISAVYLAHATQKALLMPLSFLLFVILGRAFFTWAKEVVGFKASALVRKNVRHQLIEHILRLSPNRNKALGSAALTSAALEQVEALHDFFAYYLPQMVLVLLAPITILITVFYFNWIAGLVLLITAPLIPLFMALIGMGAESVSQKHFQALARMSGHFLDILQGISTLKLFGQSKSQAKIIHDVAHDYRDKTMAVLRIAFMSSAALELFASIAIALLAVYLGLGLLGHLHGGTYGHGFNLNTSLFILLLAPAFYLPLRELGVYYHARAQAVGASEEMLKIFAEPGLHTAVDSINLPDNDVMQITFKHVDFRYADDVQLSLRNINLSITPGQHIAIIGESGAGKSTLLNLIMGMLLPTSGEILINGNELAQIDPVFWRDKVAWLGQNPLLFYGSIRDNIRFSKPDASDEEVEAAARVAHVTDFARDLPDGLDSLIGENKLGLSGGQAQRVALARVLLKDAPIVLLDEPTANLDAHSERLINQAIESYVANRTLITVTHKLGSLLHADKVLRLVGGKLLEEVVNA